MATNQCSFIQGRQTGDSSHFLLLKELIHSIRRTERGKVGNGQMEFLKRYLEKAYDRIIWSFLHNVLKEVGFSSLKPSYSFFLGMSGKIGQFLSIRGFEYEFIKQLFFLSLSSKKKSIRKLA